MPPPPPTFDVRLHHARMISPSVRELSFERVDGAPFEFQAGQWVSLVLPLSEGEGRRSYSIASAPNQGSTFELAVTRVDGGPGSTYLHELREGSVLRALGPAGFFTRSPRAPHPALFVGTGTGVTPLRSMMLDAVRAGDSSPLWLIAGVRHEHDRLYQAEFEELTHTYPQIRVEYTISRARDDWTGRTGYVQTHVERLWHELSAKGNTVPHVYICGLERMVSAVRDLLRKQMGIDRKQVHSERYD
ncbi:MAG: FAD-dependent oxidoreductase [Polyangiaceae bacterium]|nr:FAD-dependent oxidoreductase [Polyangiaceae bacterium]